MSFNIEIESGTTARLLVGGKYCDRDIVVTAKSDDLAKQIVARSITVIDDDNITTIGDYGLAYFSRLKKVRFSQCTDFSGDYGFYWCSGLEDVELPQVTVIPINTFNGCSKLKNVYIPRVEAIQGGAFQRCTSLEKLDLPYVTIINNIAFSGCSLLSTLILRSTTMAVLESTDAFSNTPIANGTGYIYVPSALVDTYKADSNWSVYENQIRAIEDYPDICGAETN